MGCRYVNLVICMRGFFATQLGIVSYPTRSSHLIRIHVPCAEVFRVCSYWQGIMNRLTLEIKNKIFQFLIFLKKSKFEKNSLKVCKKASQTCLDDAQNMSETWLKHVWNMSRTCMKHDQNMSEAWPHHVCIHAWIHACIHACVQAWIHA